MEIQGRWMVHGCIGQMEENGEIFLHKLIQFFLNKYICFPSSTKPPLQPLPLFTHPCWSENEQLSWQPFTSSQELFALQRIRIIMQSVRVNVFPSSC